MKKAGGMRNMKYDSQYYRDEIQILLRSTPPQDSGKS